MLDVHILFNLLYLQDLLKISNYLNIFSINVSSFLSNVIYTLNQLLVDQILIPILLESLLH